MSQPVLECPAEWVNDCGCPRDHNYCWPRPDTGCCASLQVDPATDPERAAFVERILRISVQLLYGLSGRQFGLCPQTVRPCREECTQAVPPGAAWMTPDIVDGKWLNVSCTSCAGGCSCDIICEMPLPGRVESVLQVKVDGQVLDPGMYRVDNHKNLVRLPLVRETTGKFVACTPSIPNRICLVTGSGDVVQVGGNDFDISPDGSSFTLLSNIPFAVGFGRGRQSPRIVMRLCPGAVVTWDVPATLVTADATLVAQTSTSVTVGTTETNVTIVFPSAAFPGDAMTPVFTITGADGCAHLDLGAASYLVDGDVCWPTCQDLRAPDTDPDTWSVTYRRGRAVPEAGVWAAGLLACELVKACSTATACDCVLPANVKSVVREGVSIDFEQINLALGGNKGRTGIPEVDLWLQMVNPYNATGRARAYSVDRPPMRTQTWPCND